MTGVARSHVGVAWAVFFLWLRAAGAGAEGDGLPVPFAPGEVLTFALKWQFVTAGVATMRVEADENDSTEWNLEALAWSTGVVDFFYTVRDTLVATVNRQTLLPRRFVKRQHEGWYHRDSTYTFDQERGVIYREGSARKSAAFVCSTTVHDMLSVLYRVRASSLVVGDSLRIRVYEGGRLYGMSVKVLRREEITVEAGTFPCVVVEPILQSEAIFVQRGRLWVWISDDERRLPVLMKSSIPVGSIVAELVSYDANLPALPR